MHAIRKNSEPRKGQPPPGAAPVDLPRPNGDFAPANGDALAREIHDEYVREDLAAARAAIEAERFRYHELVDLDPDAHLVSNKSGVVSEANHAAARLLNVPAPYLVNKPVVVYVKMEDRLAMREAINAMAFEEHAELTVGFTPRGLPAWVGHVRLAAIRETHGGPLVGIRWIVRDVTETRRAQEEITASRERLRELTSELALAEERVRREIAVGIHDRVSQPLALVKILLGKFKLSASSEQARAMEEMNGLLQQAIDESRTLTFELSPPVLYELGLPAAVEWLAEQMQRRHGVKIRSHSDALNEPIPIDIRVLLFQSIRELLTNIIKHANARNASVSLRTDEGKVEIIVVDDGSGDRKPGPSKGPASAGGFGLFNIRTRVERVGGQFLFESRRRRGTRVRLLVPMQQNASAAETVVAEWPKDKRV